MDNISKNYKEEWKPIPGYEGIYEISNLGRIFSLERTIVDCTGAVRPIHANMMHKRPSTTNGKQYNVVHLCKDGESKKVAVRRLVAEAFVPNPTHSKIVKSKDGNTLNDHFYNLEWQVKKSK